MSDQPLTDEELREIEARLNSVNWGLMPYDIRRLIDEVRRLQDEVARLQDIIDSRPIHE